MPRYKVVLIHAETICFDGYALSRNEAIGRSADYLRAKYKNCDLSECCWRVYSWSGCVLVDSKNTVLLSIPDDI